MGEGGDTMWSSDVLHTKIIGANLLLHRNPTIITGIPLAKGPNWTRQEHAFGDHPFSAHTPNSIDGIGSHFLRLS